MSESRAQAVTWLCTTVMFPETPLSLIPQGGAALTLRLQTPGKQQHWSAV